MKFSIVSIATMLCALTSYVSSKDTAIVECTNGVDGYDGLYFLNEYVHVCCPVLCNGCGGRGCHLMGAKDGLDEMDCCTSAIVYQNVTCDYSGVAPCLIERLSSVEVITLEDIKNEELYGQSVKEPTSSGIIVSTGGFFVATLVTTLYMFNMY